MVGNAHLDVVIEGVVQPCLVPEIGSIIFVFVSLVTDLGDGLKFFKEGNAKSSDRFVIGIIEFV